MTRILRCCQLCWISNLQDAQRACVVDLLYALCTSVTLCESCVLQGMRKRVGFQYNADEDTVDDIAVEMLENLSLMPQQVSNSNSSSSGLTSSWPLGAGDC